MNLFVCLKMALWQQAQTLRKSELADKVNPFFLLGQWATFVDGSSNQWAVWEAEGFTDSQLHDLEFWAKNLELMPTINGGLEAAKLQFEIERKAIPFQEREGSLRAYRAGEGYCMRVYVERGEAHATLDPLPDSWQVYSEEL